MHPKALKDTTPYSQTFRWICCKAEVITSLKDLKDAFTKRGYQSKILDHQFKRAMTVDRKILLEIKEKPSTHENLLTLKNHYPTLKTL